MSLHLNNYAFGFYASYIYAWLDCYISIWPDHSGCRPSFHLESCVTPNLIPCRFHSKLPDCKDLEKKEGNVS